MVCAESGHWRSGQQDVSSLVIGAVHAQRHELAQAAEQRFGRTERHAALGKVAER